MRFQKLRTARASHDTHPTERAEMEYYQSHQHLYTAVQDAVAEKKCAQGMRNHSDTISAC
ncbi:hypothetical protein C6503_19580 [Candidatus Poribacteria bacterium]|nr:MAG: hypothetical protein C6503_19580 [Candidatus Poribacteria bacterium]